METETRTLNELCSLPWTREVVPDEHGFFACIQELKGCISEGETPTKAFENLEDALFIWLEVAMEQGILIPQPTSEVGEFSGRFSVRIPKTLHRALVLRAEQEGVSLNQLVSLFLGSSLSWG